jgi:quercetin 2,3-dioxygenase
MITLLRSDEREHRRTAKRESWHTFRHADVSDRLSGGFGALAILSEERVAPGAAIRLRRDPDSEVVTYVRDGVLAHEDAGGRSHVIESGEFQRTSAEGGAHNRQTNAWPKEWAHVFRLWLRPSLARVENSEEQRRFCVGDRRGVLCMVASPDGRRGTLRLREDVFVFSGLLAAGQHVIHALSPGRCAWLHLVAGEALVNDVVLWTGDGAGMAAVRAVSLTAREETEILLVESQVAGQFFAGGALADLPAAGEPAERPAPIKP